MQTEFEILLNFLSTVPGEASGRGSGQSLTKELEDQIKAFASGSLGKVEKDSLMEAIYRNDAALAYLAQLIRTNSQPTVTS